MWFTFGITVKTQKTVRSTIRLLAPDLFQWQSHVEFQALNQGDRIAQLRVKKVLQTMQFCGGMMGYG